MNDQRGFYTHRRMEKYWVYSFPSLKSDRSNLEKLQFGMEPGQSDDDRTNQHPLTRGMGLVVWKELSALLTFIGLLVSMVLLMFSKCCEDRASLEKPQAAGRRLTGDPEAVIPSFRPSFQPGVGHGLILCMRGLSRVGWLRLGGRDQGRPDFHVNGQQPWSLRAGPAKLKVQTWLLVWKWCHF